MNNLTNCRIWTGGEVKWNDAGLHTEVTLHTWCKKKGLRNQNSTIFIRSLQTKGRIAILNWFTQKWLIYIKHRIHFFPVTYLRKEILSFCREHLTNSIASALETQGIPLIARTSSPTAMDCKRSAFPPRVIWNIW